MPLLEIFLALMGLVFALLGLFIGFMAVIRAGAERRSITVGAVMAAVQCFGLGFAFLAYAVNSGRGVLPAAVTAACAGAALLVLKRLGLTPR